MNTATVPLQIPTEGAAELTSRWPRHDPAGAIAVLEPAWSLRTFDPSATGVAEPRWHGERSRCSLAAEEVHDEIGTRHPLPDCLAQLGSDHPGRRGEPPTVHPLRSDQADRYDRLGSWAALAGPDSHVGAVGAQERTARADLGAVGAIAPLPAPPRIPSSLWPLQCESFTASSTSIYIDGESD